MQKRNAWIVLAAIAAMGSGACSRSDQPKDLAALDNAYKAGVLNKDEYAARKAALSANGGAVAALEKAYSAGVFTKDEYLAKKSALLAVSSLPGPSAAVIPVSDTTAEPQPQRAATAPAPSNAPPKGPSVMADGKAYRMKLVPVIDAHGFERPMPSVTLLIPTDWQSQGGTEWVLKDSCNTIRTSFKASGPEGKGIEFFPQYQWSWADDPTFLQRVYAQKAQMGGHACDVMQPMSAADYLRRNLRQIRPQAQLMGIEPVPRLLEEAQRNAQQAEQRWAQARLPRRIRADVARARVRYTVNGQEVEEWVLANITVVAVTAPAYSVARGGMVQATSYTCTAVMNAVRAPVGKLEASEKFFQLMISTVRANPEWVARVTKNAQQMQQIELKGIRDRAAINAKSADDRRNTQREMYENQQHGVDSRSNDFANYQRDVEDYRNPSTGETVKLSNQYGNAWVNNRGEYLLSDQASFDPNTVSTESWKPLQRVKQ